MAVHTPNETLETPEPHRQTTTEEEPSETEEELAQTVDWDKYDGVSEYRQRVDNFLGNSVEELRKKHDEDYDGTTYEEMWDNIQEEHREKVLKPQVEEHFKEMAESQEAPDWMKPAHMSKSVDEMKGEELLTLLNEANQEGTTEELAQSEAEAVIDSIEEKPDLDHIEINETSEELSEEAIDGFSERAKQGKSYWSDTVEAIEMEQKAPSPTSIAHRDSDTLEIRTGNSEFAEELRQDKDVKIERDNGDRIIAVASKETHGLH